MREDFSSNNQVWKQIYSQPDSIQHYEVFYDKWELQDTKQVWNPIQTPKFAYIIVPHLSPFRNKKINSYEN
jgi:hypothetical protein